MGTTPKWIQWVSRSVCVCGGGVIREDPGEGEATLDKRHLPPVCRAGRGACSLRRQSVSPSGQELLAPSRAELLSYSSTRWEEEKESKKI